jgi:cytochrome c peroxidase
LLVGIAQVKTEGQMSHKKVVLVILIFIALSMVIAASVLAEEELTPLEELGRLLYFDENLSEPAGQSCASCHHPDFAFVDPDSNIPVSEGVIPRLFGGRNSPMAAYAMYSPIRFFAEEEGLWIGGQFWDSRATGEVLGDPLADQALGPFLNPVEMANTSKDQVIADVATSDYAGLFEEVWGAGSLDNVEAAYDQVALSIAAFERTGLFGQFTSKYDYYLQRCIALGGDQDLCATGNDNYSQEAGSIFSKKEWQGFLLFMGENDNDGILEAGEGAMCVACHVADWTPDPGNVYIPDWSPNGDVPPLFTDFTYDNLGVPKSKHKLLRDNAVDLGLGPIVYDDAENGKFKVMPLRNIADTAPYAHNGFFLTLDKITHFYNTRDVKNWDPPEVPETVNAEELGNLGLKGSDEEALVQFMKTLSDGYLPK